MATFLKTSRVSALSVRTVFSNPRRLFSSSPPPHGGGEYAFEMTTSTIRFGSGVSREIGADLISRGISQNVIVITDPNMAKLQPTKTVLDSLTKNSIQFDLYDKVAVEPTDLSMMDAINYCRRKQCNAFVAVGGGSAMDTAKAANLYSSYPERDFLDFVNAPIGKGMPVPGNLKPLIAVPTTAGTGSETTGVCIFDLASTGAKTGIRDRALRPTLGLVDPDHLATCSRELTAFAGLDVLCHALESYTAVPYRLRGPAPDSHADYRI